MDDVEIVSWRDQSSNNYLRSSSANSINNSPTEKLRLWFVFLSTERKVVSFKIRPWETIACDGPFTLSDSDAKKMEIDC